MVDSLGGIWSCIWARKDCRSSPGGARVAAHTVPIDPVQLAPANGSLAVLGLLASETSACSTIHVNPESGLGSEDPATVSIVGA